MSRSLSTTFRNALMAQETVQVYLILLEIDDDSLVNPIRVVNNYASVSSGGNTYTAFPFSINLPDDTGDELPDVKLTIDNCARELTAAVRAITGIPTLNLSVVLASSPDTIEVGPLPFSMRDIVVGAATITATLIGEDILNQKYPKDSMTPQLFPGLF